MMTGRQDGFTIIETMLFLAISGALFVGAAMYMSGTISATRFRDGVTSTESFVEKQYTEVQTNAINRPVLPAGQSLACSVNPSGRYTDFILVSENSVSNTCVVLGVALRFNASNQIDTYPVIGTDKGVAAVGTSALAAMRPTIYDGASVDVSVSVGPSAAYALPWQSFWINGATPGLYNNVGAAAGFNTLAILRSPDSETVNTYVFSPTYETDDSVRTSSRRNLYDAVTTTAQANRPAIVCFRNDASGTLRGAIVFNGSTTASSNFSLSSIGSRIAPVGSFLGVLSCA